jgi:putative CocE/NonD family hydrolase
LKGVENGLVKTPRVKVFVMGDNEWREEHEWPLPNTEYTYFFFHSSGSASSSDKDGYLDTVLPGEEPPDRFVYDPLNPVAMTLRADMWRVTEHLKDRLDVEQRPDVLTYSTAVLESDVEITGPIEVVLHASSSALDTDFTAALVDVFPDGYSQLIQEGIVRARYRLSDTEPSLIEPHQVYEYRIDLWSTSYVVKKAHRIRVEISSSNFTRFDRNLNTGHKTGMSSEAQKAEQTIYHDGARPSRIILPIIPK